MADVDFTKLDPSTFELLCKSLVLAERFSDLNNFAKPGAPDRGIDWVLVSPQGTRGVAEVKHFTRPITSPSIIQRSLTDLQNGMALLNVDFGLLMLSVPLTPHMRTMMRQPLSNILVWDAIDINNLLHQYPEILQKVININEAIYGIEALISDHEPLRESSNEAARNLIERLRQVAPGTSQWRDYEDICIDILNYAFLPPLRPPRIQTTSEDGLDRRDAVYPVGSGNPFWESVKYEFSSRMVVAEFKNYVDPIGQGQVESLQQYLLPKAKRSFGLLCSRLQPSESAIKARRRAWLVAENIILFLSDGDLEEIIRIRSEDGDPSSILDQQLDEFFITLSP